MRRRQPFGVRLVLFTRVQDGRENIIRGINAYGN